MRWPTPGRARCLRVPPAVRRWTSPRAQCTRRRLVGHVRSLSLATPSLSPPLHRCSICLPVASVLCPSLPVLAPCRLRALPRCLLFSTRRVRTLALDPCFLPLSRPFSLSDSACRIRALALDATLSTSDLHFLCETNCGGIHVSSPTAAYRRGQKQRCCRDFSRSAPLPRDPSSIVGNYD